MQLHDWLILTACQTVKEYFMLRDNLVAYWITFIDVHIHFFVLLFVVHVPTEYIQLLNRFIRPLHETQIVVTTPRQSGPWSNCNERALHTNHISWAGASPSNAVWCNTSHFRLSIRRVWVLILGRRYSQHILSPTDKSFLYTVIWYQVFQLIQIVCTQECGFKYSDLILIIILFQVIISI